MSNQKRIESEWNKFEKTVIPRNASGIQRKEMRRAFYAGVSAMLKTAKQLTDDNITEEEGAMALDAIQTECIEFLKRVGKDF